MPQPPPLDHASAPRTVDWWSRNWKWFVPVVGLGGLTLVGGGIALIVSLAFGMIKATEPYQAALAQANTSAEVQEALGTPIAAGFFVTGKINFENDDGTAVLSIPLSGPNGTGTFDVQATKTSGHWNYAKVVVTIAADGRQIDLTSATNNPAVEVR